MEKFLCLLCMVVFCLCHGQARAADFAWQEGMVTEFNGSFCYQKNFFRIFFKTSGKDAVPAGDSNKNNVPDYVEDLAKQFWAADKVFCSIYQFRSPLQAPLYSGMDLIDIYVLHSANMQEMRGIALYQPEAAAGFSQRKSLRMYISTALDFRRDATAVHEYFHLVQNGMSPIKNRWYYEGLARWAENALYKRAVFAEKNWDMDKIFQSATAWDYVVSVSYDGAQIFWNPLSVRNPGQEDFSLMLTEEELNALKTLTYSNNTKVFQDFLFPGAERIKYFLEALEREGNKTGKKWTAENSREKVNNKIILEALKTTK